MTADPIVSQINSAVHDRRPLLQMLISNAWLPQEHAGDCTDLLIHTNEEMHIIYGLCMLAYVG